MYLGPTSVALRAVGVTVGGGVPRTYLGSPRGCRLVLQGEGVYLGPTSVALRAVGVTVGGGVPRTYLGNLQGCWCYSGRGCT